MKIIIDAMGGDNAPGEIGKGAVRAKRELGVDVTLVGVEDKVKACLEAEGCTDIDVVNATEVVTMEDDPSTATRRKKDSSMAVALNLLKDGAGDAVVSAGSTGALLTGATMYMQQKLMPSPDPNQARMMNIMSLVFIVFFYNMPAGLTLYMTVNQLASIAQMLIFRHWDNKAKALAAKAQG